jgi:hypothetical protein
MSKVYHFTDTVRLPWIVAADELCPGRNQIGGYPIDFLWATTSKLGDRTSVAMHGGYRQDMTALVRMTLHPDDFEPWPDILRRFPQWTSAHVHLLESTARRLGETNISGWRARAESLPLSRVISVEAKRYHGGWQAIDLAAVCVVGPGPSMRGVVLGDTVFASIQHIEPSLPTAYRARKMLRDEWDGQTAVTLGDALQIGSSPKGRTSK